MITKDNVMEKLKEVVDPEIGLNIVDLGLIYEVAIGQDNSVNIKMTLTTPGCPMHDSMALWAQRAVESLPKVGPVEVPSLSFSTRERQRRNFHPRRPRRNLSLHRQPRMSWN